MTKILIILSLLLIIVSCNNSTEPEDNTLYVGESYLNNGLYLSAPDTISIDDTLEIITSLPKQKYRLKGRMFIFSSGFHDSVIRLLKPNAYKDQGNQASPYPEDVSRWIEVDLYPDSSFSQSWSFISQKNLNVERFESSIVIDSIYLDMDTLRRKGELYDISPLAVEEKRWYICDFGINSSDDREFLLDFFMDQNVSSSNFKYVSFKGDLK